MQTVVGVSFKKAGKIYYFDPSGIELRYEDSVIVETSRGIELGQVVINPKEVEEDQIIQPLKVVIRKATPKDLEQLEINQQKEKDAYNICLEKIANHGLPMKLVDVEYTFDNNKIIFYFTADGRVDFRELVKDLASVFRTRIELRQIGVRDEAKMIGGLGPCGLELCCKTFLREFEPISIKMAKSQELSLNPAKISGICGRLMCCLRYECDTYDDDVSDDDIIIDDPVEVIKLADELEVIDEYEKYSGFAKKYAKVPEVLVEEDDDALKANKKEPVKENQDNKTPYKKEDKGYKNYRTDKPERVEQSSPEANSAEQNTQQVEQPKKPYYNNNNKNRYRNNYNNNNPNNSNNNANANAGNSASPANTYKNNYHNNYHNNNQPNNTQTTNNNPANPNPNNNYNNNRNFRNRNNFYHQNNNPNQGDSNNHPDNNNQANRKPYERDQGPNKNNQ